MSDNTIPTPRMLWLKATGFEGQIERLSAQVRIEQKWNDGIQIYRANYQDRFTNQTLSTPDLSIGQGKENAFAHAYASALLVLNYDPQFAKDFGNLREARSVGEKPNAWQTQLDNYTDLFNNEVGYKIGAYAKANNLSPDDVKRLVIASIDSGETINRYDDSRIPYNFSGLPSGFNATLVNWSGPPSSFSPTPRCFIAGTPILMADGTEKPIQEVDAGDMVMSFDPNANDGLGAMVPQMVTRTFVNTTRVLIDLHGLKVTPGHEFLADRGEWMRIADILRRDRAFVRNDEDGLGVPHRARTNQPLKSFGDAVFKTRFIDPRTGAERRAEVRGAIPFEKVYSVMSGIQTRRNASLLEVLHFDGRISVQAFAENGRLCDNEDKPVGVLDWPAGTTPFDIEGAENHIVTLDGFAFTPDWVKRIPRDGEETQAVMNAGGGESDCLLLSPEGVKTMHFKHGKGTFNEPAPRQALPPQKPVLAASNPAAQPSLNRAQRRKQAALKRVH